MLELPGSAVQARPVRDRSTAQQAGPGMGPLNQSLHSPGSYVEGAVILVPAQIAHKPGQASAQLRACLLCQARGLRDVTCCAAGQVTVSAPLKERLACGPGELCVVCAAQAQLQALGQACGARRGAEDSSCPLLLGLPEDVQAQISATLVDDDLEGIQALLRLRTASKRAAYFGSAGVGNVGLEQLLIWGHTLQLQAGFDASAALVLSTFQGEGGEAGAPAPGCAHDFADVQSSQQHLFCGVLARASVVQAAIARQRVYRPEDICCAGLSGAEAAQASAKFLDSAQCHADCVVAKSHELLRLKAIDASMERCQRRLAQLQALLPRPVQPPALPAKPDGVRGGRSWLTRLFCLGLPGPARDGVSM